MEFLWFGQFGRPVMLFPTSGGRFTENEDFHLTGALSDKVDRGEIQLCCVDSVDGESWYNKWAHPADRARRHTQYDAYLRHEMIPYIQHRAQRSDLVTYGASFGAYHAANLAGRYPDVVSKAICFSGMYDVHQYLDGYWDENCYFHCPTAYIPNMDSGLCERLARVSWVIATGETARKAFHAAVAVEESAQIAFLALQLGTPSLVPADEIARMNDFIHHRYGKS